MLQAIRVLNAGESYWKVRLANNKTLCELDTKPVEVKPSADIDTGLGLVLPAMLTRLAPRVRMRRMEWLEDLIGSGDIQHVREAVLCTPQGEACFSVKEPYTVFQFSRGTLALDPLAGQVRLKNAQVVGVVTDREAGTCEFAAWDVQMRQLYLGYNNVKDFRPWRPGMLPIGQLNLELLDVRGVTP